jgi:hypothetical protein
MLLTLIVTFEIIGMLAKPLRIRGSNFRMIPNPTADKWLGYVSNENPTGSVIDWTDAMEAFKTNLVEFVAMTSEDSIEDGIEDSLGPQARVILKELDYIIPFLKKPCDIDMREALHNGLDRTVDYLGDHTQVTLFDIMGVVASHVTAVINSSETIQSSINVSKDPTSEFIQSYFKEIQPKIKADYIPLRDIAESKRNAIWITLMFRMICWFLLHDFNKNDVNVMPSDMMGSRMPVFIS